MSGFNFYYDYVLIPYILYSYLRYYLWGTIVNDCICQFINSTGYFLARPPHYRVSFIIYPKYNLTALSISKCHHCLEPFLIIRRYFPLVFQVITLR